jgi:hypothetical protein
MKYYIRKNDIGQLEAFSEREGRPVKIEEYSIVELPENKGMLFVKSKGRAYPDYKVANAVFLGQISINDLEVK